MNELENLTKKFILVNMDEAKISTSDKPIIGTHALATCTGLLLYCKERKVAIVAHISTNIEEVVNKVLDLLESNNIKFSNIEYRIIPGYDRYDEEIINTIIRKLRFGNISRLLSNHLVPFSNSKIRRNDVQTDVNTLSNQFAFDAETGKFVSDKVVFGVEYYVINPNDGFTENINKKYN